MIVNHAVFCGVATLLLCVYSAIAGWLSIICGWDFCYSGPILVFIGQAIPLASEDINLVGEITPTALAGLMVVFAPRDRSQQVITLVYAALFSIIYGLYLTYTIFVGSNEFLPIVADYLENDEITPETIRSSIISFVGSVRLFSVVVASALIGLWLQIHLPSRH